MRQLDCNGTDLEDSFWCVVFEKLFRPFRSSQVAGKKVAGNSKRKYKEKLPLRRRASRYHRRG